MVEKLMRYFEALQSKRQSMIITLEYNKTFGWVLEIWHRDSNTKIFYSDNCSLNLTCAMGYVALEDWAIEFDDLRDIGSNM